MKLLSPLFIAFLLLVSSCTSKTDKAQEIVRDFSKALSNVDSIAIKRIYPSSASFFNLFPTMGDIDEISAKEDGDYILVDCKSGHYDEHSHFVQSKFSCWVKDEDGKLIISDSKGLITLPEEFGTYPYEIGAVTKYSKDVELGNKYDDIQRCFYTECLRNVMALNLGIERVSWSWEADYGTPNGDCTIKNTLPFTVKNVKYKITYYRGDEIVGEDDGTAASSIDPGSMKSFRFYSSGVNGYRARTARISFEVPESQAIEWTLRKSYTGNEFKEYLDTKEPKSSSI